MAEQPICNRSSQERTPVSTCLLSYDSRNCNCNCKSYGSMLQCCSMQPVSRITKTVQRLDRSRLDRYKLLLRQRIAVARFPCKTPKRKKLPPAKHTFTGQHESRLGSSCLSIPASYCCLLAVCKGLKGCFGSKPPAVGKRFKEQIFGTLPLASLCDALWPSRQAKRLELSRRSCRKTAVY